MSLALGIPYAFTAGILALFSPCGFAMLPGYISYYLGTEASTERAITIGVACASGLVAVFSAVGLAASAMGNLVSRYVPFLELGGSLLTILMGLTMVLEIGLPASWPSLRVPRRRSFLSVFLYGVAYGLVTIGCSAPIFFSVLFYAVLSGGIIQGTFIFFVYSLGMGLPLVLATIAIARAREIIVKRVLGITPLLHRLAGVVLVVAGAYTTVYYFAILSST